MGLSREIINNQQTLSTLETLTISFFLHSVTPPVGIAEELRTLSLSNGNALERIRLDFQCNAGLTSGAGFLECLESLNLNHVQWSGFSHLWLLEVEIEIFVGSAGAPTDSSSFTGYLERVIREIFRRAINRAGVEVSVTLYLNSTRPGGDTFRRAVSWERFATLTSN